MFVSVIIGLSISILGFAQSINAYLIVDIAPSEVNELGAGWTVKELDDLGGLGSGDMLALSASISGTNYTVSFKSDIYGWKAPEDMEVTIQPGKSTKIVGIYEQEKGSLQVNIYPVTAVEAGAKWRREGQETWLDSETIEQDIPVGKYTIEFYKIDNWDTPPEPEVTILDKELVTIDAYYTQHLGALQVNISPQEVVTAGAKWKIRGKTDWLDSGFNYENLPVGTYTVEFKEIPNWQTPPSSEVTIEKGQTKVLTVEYVSLILEGTNEGEGEISEGEGEDENDIWGECGCNNSEQEKKLRDFLVDILFVGLLIIITASSRNSNLSDRNN